MELSIKESGSKMRKMDMESINTKMEISMLVNLKMVWEKEKDSIPIGQVMYLKEHGKLVKKMEMESTIGKVIMKSEFFRIYFIYISFGLSFHV